MSYDVDDWLAHPEVQALLDRAETYSREVYATTDTPPDRFLVTAEEYVLLQRLRAPSSVGVNAETLSQVEAVPIYLFGMRVCRPVRLQWYRDNHYMEHFDLFHPTNPSHRRPPIPLEMVLGRCLTEYPHTLQPEVTCPCGQVIWDLSTSTWWHNAPAGLVAWLQAEASRMVQGVNDAPLPSLTSLGVPEAWHDHVSMRLPDIRTIRGGRDISDEQWRAAYTRWFNELVASTSLRPHDTREVMETPDSALPDETLTCCGQVWLTHATWMEHYPKAHGYV